MTMNIRLKPNIYVGVAFIGVILLTMWMGTSIVMDALNQDAAPGLIAGCALLLLGLGFMWPAVEGLSLRIDEEGIQQRRVVWRRRYFLKRRLAWRDMKAMSQKGYVFDLIGDDFEVRLNLAYFNDMDTVIKFINDNLPSSCRRSSE